MKCCRFNSKGLVRYCEMMDERINPEANAKMKGLTQINVTNRITGQITVMGVCFFKNSKDRGLMLNNCPWCGKNVLIKGRKEQSK